LPASAADGDWQHTLFIYGMGAAIDGHATIGDITVPVELSWRFNLRGDIGGFGVGSNSSYQRFDLTEQGPLIGLAISF
jgi:hypothetical protein